MKLLPAFLLIATTAHSQLPDPPSKLVASSFWPKDTITGAIRFAGVPTCASTLQAAQRAHVVAWLDANCVSGIELPQRKDSTWVYVAPLDGFRDGMSLQFDVRLRQLPTSWHYDLGGFMVNYQTGLTPIFQRPLRSIFRDPEMEFDVEYFETQLRRSLPKL